MCRVPKFFLKAGLYNFWVSIVEVWLKLSKGVVIILLELCPSVLRSAQEKWFLHVDVSLLSRWIQGPCRALQQVVTATAMQICTASIKSFKINLVHYVHLDLGHVMSCHVCFI